MKKRIVAVILIVLAVITLTACRDKLDNAYFNDFVSRGQFSSAEELVSLSKGTSVYSYDVESDVFITNLMVLSPYDESEYMNLFGFASTTQEYLSPRYTEVLSVHGDYAIVTKPAIGLDDDGKNALKPKVAVVKFRGSEPFEIPDIDFYYEETYDQLAFVGNFIMARGEYQSPTSLARYATFYDYSTGRLLEKFKVRCGVEFSFQIYDKYLVAVGKNRAYFYETNEVLTNGYLFLDDRANYVAYPEDVDDEYKSVTTVSVYYLGNGNFTRTARMESTEIFQGYNICYESVNATTGESSLVYANIRSDLYDAKTRSINSNVGWLWVENVANSHNTRYFSDAASSLNNLSSFDEKTGRYEYSLPYMDMSKIVKNGFSIVYYYYLPYVDEGNYRGEITFCIMDEKASIVNLEDMLMPTVFVDGVGVESADPMYDEYFGGVYSYDKSLKKTELVPYKQGEKSYATYLYHERALVASEINYADNTVKYGAVSSDGRIILPFIYDELSPYYGGYAVGTRTENGKTYTYKIDTAGAEEAIYDVVNVRQGTYLYDYRGKLGIKNYAGDIILNAEYDELEVFEIFLTKGEYQTSIAVGIKDNVTTVYRLK